MDLLIRVIQIGVIMLVVRILVWVWMHRRKGREKQKLPYFKKRYFVSEAELSFFKVLEQAIENKYYIFPQVRISDLVYVKTNKEEYQRYHNKINKKSVDFVIVEKSNLNPLLAIELDDRSHDNKKRIERDDFVKNVFKEVGLPLLRIKCAATYDVQKVRTDIENIF